MSHRQKGKSQGKIEMSLSLERNATGKKRKEVRKKRMGLRNERKAHRQE
jgi:hypothetical protein